MPPQDAAKASLKKFGKPTYDPVVYTAGFYAGWSEAMEKCLAVIRDVNDKYGKSTIPQKG